MPRPAVPVSRSAVRATCAVGAALLTLAPVAARRASADWPEISRRGVLRVIYWTGVPAYSFTDAAGGHAPGLDREVLEGFAKYKRLRLQAVPVERWGDVVPALLRGNGDVVGGLGVTGARRRQIAFTREVLPAPAVVVTRAPRPAVASLEELRGLRVGTVKGTSWAEAVARAGVPSAQVDDGLALSVESCAEALRSGRVAAVIMSAQWALVAARRDPELRIGVAAGTAMSMAYGLRTEDEQLRAELDAYLDELRRSPTWSRLLIDYFGASAPSVLGRH